MNSAYWQEEICPICNIERWTPQNDVWHLHLDLCYTLEMSRQDDTVLEKNEK